MDCVRDCLFVNAITNNRFSVRTVRLIAMCNRIQHTISTGSGLELLQLVLEIDTLRCANEDAGLSRGWIVTAQPTE